MLLKNTKVLLIYFRILGCDPKKKKREEKVGVNRQEDDVLSVTHGTNGCFQSILTEGRISAAPRLTVLCDKTSDEGKSFPLASQMSFEQVNFFVSR